MKRIFLIALLVSIYLIPTSAYATQNQSNTIITEQLENVTYFDEIAEYLNQSSELVEELKNPNELISNMLTNDEGISTKNLFNNILKLVFSEFYTNINFAIKIIVISIFCGILKGLQANFSGRTSQVGFYICFILMISMLIVGFKDVLNMGKTAVKRLSGFMQIAIPALLTLMAASGKITSSTTLYPILLLFVQIVSTVFTTILLPMLSFYGVFSIISNISDKKDFSKVGKLIKTVGVWILGVVATVFVAVITTQSNIAGTVDEVASKTTKFAFSSMIPVVGKTLSDAVDTVMSCSLAIKDVAGWISVVVIMALVALPALKIMVMIFIYKFLSAIIEPISDTRISSCLSDLSDVLSLLLAVIFTISIIFVIALTIGIKLVTKT